MTMIAEHRDESGELIIIYQREPNYFVLEHLANVKPGEYHCADHDIISVQTFETKEKAVGAYVAEVADWLSCEFMDEEPVTRMVIDYHRCGRVHA